MKIENTNVFNIYGAVKASYNYLENYEKFDYFELDAKIFFSGDTELHIHRLCKKGLRPSHRKFLRQIFVTAEITAPLYFWKQFDTYKIGTTTQSTSTMNSIMKRPLSQHDFEKCIDNNYLEYLNDIISDAKFAPIDSINKTIFQEVISGLPSGYLQMRTWSGNYETLRAIVEDRSNHKLDEWKKVIDWIKTLPYADIMIMEE